MLDVIATRADGMRGQAFVAFGDIQSATSALRALEGFGFYDKPLVRTRGALHADAQSIDYARTKSHASIIAERGEDALYNAALTGQSAEDDASGLSARVTYSHAQTEQEALDKKRPWEAGEATSAAAADGAEADGARPVKSARTDEPSDDDDDDDDAMQIGDSDSE